MHQSRLSNFEFQVLWLGKTDVHVTWEPESSLPQAAIDEFVAGAKCETVQQRSNRYGQEACTLLVEQPSPVTLQQSKRSKKDRPLLQSNTG